MLRATVLSVALLLQAASGKLILCLGDSLTCVNPIHPQPQPTVHRFDRQPRKRRRIRAALVRPRPSS